MRTSLRRSGRAASNTFARPSRKAAKSIGFSKYAVAPSSSQYSFVLAPAFPRHDDDGNQLRGSYGFECPAKLKPGIIGHSQIEQNGVRFALQGRGKREFRVTRIDDLVAIFEIDSHQTPDRRLIIDDQQFLHGAIFSYLLSSI